MIMNMQYDVYTLYGSVHGGVAWVTWKERIQRKLVWDIYILARATRELLMKFPFFATK